MKKFIKNIIVILFIVVFFVWISFGPEFLSSNFCEVDESQIKENINIIEYNSSLPLTCVIDKFELRHNSYREIIEISGFAFSNITENIKKREILLYIKSKSKKKEYIVNSKLIKKDDVLLKYIGNKPIQNFVNIGFYMKFPGIVIKNDIYELNFIVKENDNIAILKTQYLLKKDRGIITIVSKN